MTRPTRYSILESCMRPSGAYAKTQASFTDEATARRAFQHATFEGPGFGILWGKEVSLIQSGATIEQRYLVLATKRYAA